MKRLIIWLVALLSFAQAFSQGNDTTKYVYYRYTYGNRLARYWADTVLQCPKDTIWSKDGIAIKGGIFYIGNGIKWTAVTGSGGTTDTLAFTTWQRLYKTIDSMKIVNDARYFLRSDTAQGNVHNVTSIGQMKKVRDSLAALIAGGGGLSPIPNITYLGNISGSSAVPIPLNMPWLTLTDFSTNTINDSSHDALPAFNAAMAACPAGGCVIFIPGGVYFTSDSIHVIKSIRFVGVNNILGSAFLGTHLGGSIVYGGSNDKPVFVFDQDASTGFKPVIGIEHIAVLSNKSSTPADGSVGILIRGFLQQVFIEHCTVKGFYRDVDIQSAFYFTIAHNWIGGSISSAIRINDLDRTDTGDWGIYDNQIIAGNFTGSSKGIEWHSGGGIKIWGNKFDAQSFTVATQFTYPIFIANSVDPTSDVQIYGNSIEDYQITAIYDSCLNNTTGPISHHIITGNQIAGVGSTGPGITIINANFVQLADNHIKDWAGNSTSGMRFVNCNKVQVATTYVVNFTTLFVNSGSLIDKMDAFLSNDSHTALEGLFAFDGNIVIGAPLDSNLARLHLPAGTTAIAPMIIPAGPLTTVPKIGAIENDGTAAYYTDNSGVRHNLLSVSIPSGNTGDVLFKFGSVLGASDAFNWDNGASQLNITGTFHTSSSSTFGVTNKFGIFPDQTGKAIIGTSSGHLDLVANTDAGTAGDSIRARYYDGSVYQSAWSVANVASGKSILQLMPAGGTVKIGGAAVLSTYGSGTHTGTAAFCAAYDASGNLIEVACAGSPGTIHVVGDADYTVASGVEFVNYSTTLTATRTITLPAASSNSGRHIHFWLQSAGGNQFTLTSTSNIILTGTSSSTTQTTNQTNVNIDMLSDGTTWITTGYSHN